jgi:geranylgeranyl diphosphate synthase type I
MPLNGATCLDNLPKHAAESEAVPLPAVLVRYREEVGRALRSSLSQDEPEVYGLLKYYMGWVDEHGYPSAGMQGKGLRPILCLFACEAVGGTRGMAMPAAVALEFIHIFSLIHDDIQDEDETRHNRKTLWARWGVPKALVAGNVLRVVADQALHRLVQAGLEHDRALSAMGLLTEAYLEMIEGQYLDLSFEGRTDVGVDDYFQMISRKTGALIRCSLARGAVVGSDDPAVARAFRECGRALGYVFQIRDDVLGVWGEEERTGKPVGADIRRKKNSYPVVYAMEKARRRDAKRLNEIYEKDSLDDADVVTVLDVMDRANVKWHAQNNAANYAEAAMDSISHVELSRESRNEIEDLTRFLLVRDR